MGVKAWIWRELERDRILTKLEKEDPDLRRMRPLVYYPPWAILAILALPSLALGHEQARPFLVLAILVSAIWLSCYIPYCVRYREIVKRAENEGVIDRRITKAD
jgi:hypothetical protein